MFLFIYFILLLSFSKFVFLRVGNSMLEAKEKKTNKRIDRQATMSMNRTVGFPCKAIGAY